MDRLLGRTPTFYYLVLARTWNIKMIRFLAPSSILGFLALIRVHILESTMGLEGIYLRYFYVFELI